jgi:hypothetical protein
MTCNFENYPGHTGRKSLSQQTILLSCLECGRALFSTLDKKLALCCGKYEVF